VRAKPAKKLKNEQTGPPRTIQGEEIEENERSAAKKTKTGK